MNRYIRYALIGTAASLAAIYFIAIQIDLEQFLDAWAQARYIYALPCLVLIFAGLFTRAIRWQVLLSGGLPLRRSVSILNVSYLINGFVPFRLGELVRAYLATRAQPPVPLFKSAATIIVERLLDLLTVVLLVVFVLVSRPVPDWLRGAAMASGIIALVGFLLLVYFSRNRTLAHNLLDIMTRLLPFLKRLNFTAWLDHFLDGLLPLAKVETLLLALAWTAISWILSIAAGYVGMFAFYPSASWFATSLFIAAAAFAVAVPAVPGSLGTYELSIILALTATGYGEPAATAAAFAVSIHMLNVLSYCIAGIIGFIQEGVSLEQLSQGVRRVSQENEVRSV
ncbi:MAG: lysylphosphatidylglycerol synthase transmembrane domain-containing protein [bacterium]|nr:lysylphosphatidylglycerol synthase transmembrane domain-containing protein [bacterium]